MTTVAVQPLDDTDENPNEHGHYHVESVEQFAVGG